MASTAVADSLAPVRRSRWFVLAAFGLLVVSSQILWLTFAPITAQVHEALGVSEGAIGDLAVINPLLFVLLAIPAGRWMDRRYGAALAAGAILTAAGACLRMADPSSYAWMLVGQVVLSAGQPLVLNASTKVAARYFPPGQRTAAISVASAAQFVGILIAALTGEQLLNAGGLELVLVSHAAIAVFAALMVLISLRARPAFASEATATSLKWLRGDPVIWRLAGLLFVGVGVFNALATWLDTILTAIGQPGVAGTLIAVATVAGITGAAVLPGVAAKRNRRRMMLIVTTAVTVLTFSSIALVDNVWFTGFALAVEGFFLLAGLPIALDWSELDAGPTRAATSAGFLMLAGNLGGVVLVLLVQVLIGQPYLALAAMAAVAVPGIFLAARLPGRVPSPDGDQVARPRGVAA
jgi:predicted MFS family arabinose efflux permease